MKFISADYNPNTGISRVKIGNKYGTYEGIAKVHPEEEHKSHLAGCHIAEIRAYLNFFKTQLPRKKAALKEIEKLKKDITINCYENKDVMKRINLAIRNTTNEIEELKMNIQEAQDALANYLKTREEFLNKTK